MLELYTNSLRRLVRGLERKARIPKAGKRVKQMRFKTRRTEASPGNTNRKRLPLYH